MRWWVAALVMWGLVAVVAIVAAVEVHSTAQAVCTALGGTDGLNCSYDLHVRMTAYLDAMGRAAGPWVLGALVATRFAMLDDRERVSV